MHSIDLNLANIFNPIIDGLNNILPKIPGAILTLLVGWFLIQLTAWLVRVFMALTGTQHSFRQVLSSIISSALWAFLAIQILQELGFGNIVTFFAGSVVAIGLVMAAGGSTLVSDIIAGLFLARDNDFNVGDEVILGEVPTKGTIVLMDSRRVRVRDDKGVVHVIPNSVVERKEWVVVKRHAGHAGMTAAAHAKRLGVIAMDKAAAVRSAKDGAKLEPDADNKGEEA
jgi:small-conductance mechanosensitive channel